jgi:hypothetical protein
MNCQYSEIKIMIHFYNGRIMSTPEHKEKKRAYDERWRRNRGMRPFSLCRSEHTERIHRPEVRDKARRTVLSKRDKHEAALVWSLRSPNGAVYHFRNLACFIREHCELFTPEQLRPVNRLGRTRIESSLSLLSPRRKHCARSAHGWMWHIDGKEPESYLGILPY